MKKIHIHTHTVGPLQVEIHESEFDTRSTTIDVVDVKILRDDGTYAIFFFSVKKTRGQLIAEMQPAIERDKKVPIRKVKGVFLKPRVKS